LYKSLCFAGTNSKYTLKANTGGKVEVWKKFSLVYLVKEDAFVHAIIVTKYTNARCQGAELWN